MKKMKSNTVGIIITNALIAGLICSLFLVGRRVPRRFKKEFKEISVLYENRQYHKAIQAYHALHKKYGVESCALYYNLGNAYYKNNDLGRAILYYKRAIKLKPGDDDARHNLSKVEDEIGIKSFSKKRSWIIRFHQAILNKFSIYGWTLFSVANYWRFSIISVVVIFFGKNKKIFFYLWIIICCVFAIGLFFTINKAYLDITRKEAVILEDNTEMKKIYDPSSETIFTLRVGETVLLKEPWHNWHRIQLPDGRTGWIRSEKLGII